MSAPAIRRAAAADLPSVLALYRDAGFDDGSLSLDEAKAIFARMESYPAYHLYLAEEAGVAVGTFALLVMDNLGHGGTPAAVVEAVAVASDRRGAGIGGAMMRAAMDIARQAGCYKLALSSNQKRTDAHRFYEGLGFRPHGTSFFVELEATAT